MGSSSQDNLAILDKNLFILETTIMIKSPLWKSHFIFDVFKTRERKMIILPPAKDIILLCKLLCQTIYVVPSKLQKKLKTIYFDFIVCT